MSAVIERVQLGEVEADLPTDGLFMVWFDLNFGDEPADWWWELPGLQPLPAALDLAAQLRANDFVCKVMPEGKNPRTDGRWDNP